MSYAGRVVTAGTAGCLMSVVGLAVAARLEKLAPAQPLNATSHWMHGDRAARVQAVDLAHTGTGLATHFAATLFWACLYESWGSREPKSRPTHAVAVAMIAAIVDYTITPHRFTPGWELVLSKRGMALAYAMMALGFMITPQPRGRRNVGRSPKAAYNMV